MQEISRIKFFVRALALLVLVVAFAAPFLSSAAILDNLNCNPEKLPGEGGCGLDQFKSLLNSIIKWIGIILIPLAAIMIAWGGFVILTAGGNTGKVGEGRKIIIAAIIGIVIYLLSYLIIKTVFSVLKVKNVNVQPAAYLLIPNEKNLS